jgi:hypothetical protein
MEEDQIEFFKERSEYYKNYRTTKIDGEIPYYKYNPQYCVQASIGDLISTNDRRSIWNCYFRLFGEDHTCKIQDFNTVLVFTFKDSGEKNYKGGRYINIKMPKVNDDSDGESFIIDFNYACNLLCAYNPTGFNCDLPDNNFIKPILAGEQFVPKWQDKWFEKPIEF